MRVVHLVGSAAALSACAYHPGSFSSPNKPFIGERATVGCLDFAVNRRDDFEPPADRPVDYQRLEHGDDDYDKSAVFEYSFGNRCNQPVTLDLASLAVWAQAASGEQFRLVPYDPGMEVRALPIEGRLFGQEVISYPLPQPATRVCVNVATISPPHEEPPQWMCFDSKPPAVQPDAHPDAQPDAQPDVVAQGAP